VGPREVAQEADIQLATVLVGFPGVAIHENDLLAMDFLAWILGGGRGSRLEKALKETGWVHAVGSSNHTPRDPGLWVFSMRTDPDKVDQALHRLFQELMRIREEPISHAELEAGKKAFLLDHLLQRQTVASQAADLATYEVLLGDPLFAWRYLEGIRRIDSETLRAVARRYLDPNRATVVRLLPKGSSVAQRGSESAGHETVQARRIVLSNGMRVILKPDHRIGLVTFHLAILGGVRFETSDTHGISLLTARMLLRGTTRQSAQTINETLQRIGAEAAPFSGRNSLGIRLQVLATDWIAAARLLSEILTEPAFPSEEIEKERRLGIAECKAQEEDPFSWGMRRLTKTLFTRHPYRLDPSGNPDGWNRLKREDVLNFYQKVANPQRIVLAVVGDFDPDEMGRVLEASLGHWRGSHASDPDIPKEPALEGSRKHVEKIARNEAVLLIGFPGLALNDARLPAWEVAEGVLSGGAGRLFYSVREEKGLAYTVGAFSVPGVDPGFVVLYAVTDPAHLASVQEALWEAVDRLRREGISLDELAEVKQGVLGWRRMARQSQSAQAAQLASDELYGLGFDFSTRCDEQISAVGREEVVSVIRDLLDLNRCVVVIGEPYGEKRTPYEAEQLEEAWVAFKTEENKGQTR
jgi:zinc protease